MVWERFFIEESVEHYLALSVTFHNLLQIIKLIATHYKLQFGQII